MSSVLLLVMMIYSVVVVPFLGYESITRLLVINFVMSLGCYAYCFISTAWVNHQYAKQTKYYKQLRVNTVEKPGYQNMTLEEVLSTRDGFDVLADHLVKEFSIENLLFLFDIMQIKNQLISTKFGVYFIYIHVVLLLIVSTKHKE